MEPRSLGQTPKTSITFDVLRDGFVKLWLSELGPSLWGYPYLAVADLPQQEIADPQFSTGSDQ
jgi:hypothetical protein